MGREREFRETPRSSTDDSGLKSTVLLLGCSNTTSSSVLLIRAELGTY